MTATVLEIQQLVDVVFYEQGYFFGQGHWHRKVGNNILDVWFFLISAHRTPSRKQVKAEIKSIFKICCIVFNSNL